MGWPSADGGRTVQPTNDSRIQRMPDAVKSGNARTHSSVATRANAHPNSRTRRAVAMLGMADALDR